METVEQDFVYDEGDSDDKLHQRAREEERDVVVGSSAFYNAPGGLPAITVIPEVLGLGTTEDETACYSLARVSRTDQHIIGSRFSKRVSTSGISMKYCSLR